MKTLDSVKAEKKKATFGGDPGKNAGKFLQDARVNEIARFIASDPTRSRHDIHRKFCKKFNLGWHWIDELAKRAKEQLRKESQISQEEAKTIGLGIVTKWLGNSNPIVSLKAERAFASIHGYEAPTQARIGNPDGSPLPSAIITPVVNFVLPEKNKE